jgi:hypothetical protein
MLIHPLCRERLFGRVWRVFAACGLADDQGGAEYRRCLVDWRLAGRPLSCTGYIRGWLAAQSAPLDESADSR